MPRNGGRSVTSAELDAHLRPMRDDIATLVRDQREFAEFMTGAISSRAIEERIRKSRHFWIGVAVSMCTVAVGALTLLFAGHG